MAWLQNFNRIRRFDSNAPREPAHINLTACSRFAQRTGVFALYLLALVRFVVMNIMEGIVAFACLHCCISVDDLGLAVFWTL